MHHQTHEQGIFSPFFEFFVIETRSPQHLILFLFIFSFTGSIKYENKPLGDEWNDSTYLAREAQEMLLQS
jgi:hypothetical protein